MTADGYRQGLDFADASLQEATAVRQLLQGLLKHGLCVDRGLLCITPGTTALPRTRAEHFGPHLQQQHCQMHKRERVVSFLAEADRRRVRGAITRTFQGPDPDEAHAALMRIHTELKPRNRSAAQWLLQELDRTLTLAPDRPVRRAQSEPAGPLLRGAGRAAVADAGGPV